MPKDKLINSSKIIDRVKIALGFQKDAELADKLNVDPATVSNWRKRNNINLREVIKLIHRHDLNYILLGKTRSGNELLSDSEVSEPVLEYESQITEVKQTLYDLNHDKNLKELPANLKAEIITTLIKCLKDV